jgi:hypothetical protein
MAQNDTLRKWLPRDAAGKMDFPPENGEIKSVAGFDDYMEVYAVRATYRVSAPDNLDPARTVPNMPWSNSTNVTVGASNPIVARVVIQSIEALDNWPLRNADPKILKRHVHACKEEALACETAYNRLKPQYDAAVRRIEEGKLAVQANVIDCPSLPTLRDDVATFLTSAKRALQSVGDIFNQFYVPDNKKPLVANANFEFAIARLETSQPPNQQFIDYLKKVVPIVKRFVDLRNGLEHPSGAKATQVQDFRITPKGIAGPTWGRTTLVSEGPVLEEMHTFLDFVIAFFECVFFFGLLNDIVLNIPLEARPVAESDIDPECPVRYRLTPIFGGPKPTAPTA